jgi:hypothetical protein
MAAGAVTLLIVTAAAVAVLLTVLPSQGSPISRAAGTPAASSPAASPRPTAPAATRAAAPAPRPSASRTARVSTAPATGVRPGPQTGQYSADAGPAERDHAAAGAFGDRAQGRGGPGSRWPGRWGGSPRYGRTGVFTGALLRPAPGGRPGMFGR